MADALPVSGSIDPKTFPFVLLDLHQQGATGSLKVDGPSYQKALYFRGGRVLFGSSNDPRDQLGAILIENGKITPEQLEDVNAKVGPGSPLAKVLADTGFVSQRELSEAARAKVERILSDMLAYSSGSFEFEDGVLPKGAVDLKLSTERLVLAAVSRISDRNFVLRHLDGLDVVLAPTPEMLTQLDEIASDAGGLPDQLDGRRTLKEAASLTRLDEFEAAKVACALLFLGLVDRVEASPEAQPDVLVVPEEESPEVLDLDATSPGFPVQDTSATVVTLSEDEAPTVHMHPEEHPSPPPSPEPELPSGPTLAAGVAAAPEPVKVPPMRWEPPAPVASRQAPSRPSKEDLAALDELLNSRSLEGPLAPFEKTSQQERWSPQFGHKPTARRASSGGRRNAILIAGAAALLGVTAIGVLLFQQWRRGARVPIAAATPPPAVSPSLSSAPPPLPGVSASAAATVPTLGAASPPPPSSARPSPPPSPRSTAQASLAIARNLLRSGRVAEAAQAFSASLRGAAPGTRSIQLFVACAPETVQKAVEAVSEDELYIVPVNYKGKDCYRLCWGLYPDESRAASAMQSLPEYFRKGGAAPRVMSATEILR